MTAPVLSPWQKTLSTSITCEGEGVHNGKPVRMTIHPAAADTGIVFERMDIAGPHNTVPAIWDHVRISPLCTQIINAQGTEVRTIEHLMAALYTSGITNAHIAINGPEVPIMDGSSLPFLQLIAQAGVKDLEAPRMFLEIIRPVTLSQGDTWVTLSPSRTPRYTVSVEYPQHNVGEQSFSLDLAEETFSETVSNARTFGFRSELEYLHANGLALGGNFGNAILINEKGGIVNPGGWRCPNELARHKLLDAVGDFALAGAVILGHMESSRAGHAINNKLLRALFADESAFIRRLGADTAAGHPADALSPHILA
jgi:UDP-3-O-[3-hydroxymyristoyl] N-acetylglucosamine deacetylase